MDTTTCEQKAGIKKDKTYNICRATLTQEDKLPAIDRRISSPSLVMTTSLAVKAVIAESQSNIHYFSCTKQVED